MGSVIGPSEVRASESDKMLRRALNQWDIMFLVVGAMIGSGWLFGSLGAAATAGPAAIVSWVIGGILMMFIALAYAELGGMLPKSGGIVRYPQYTHGSFASFMLGWAYFLSAVTVAPSEAIAAVTYLTTWVHGLTVSGVLTPLGVLVAAILTIFFFLLNWFGVHVMGKTNTGVGWWKFIIPTLTFILLLGLALHPANYSHLAGGFVPFGWSAVFLAIPTTGIAYAYLGFRQGVDFSGEARRPSDVVLGTVIGFFVVMFIYIMLQVAFIGGLDFKKLYLVYIITKTNPQTGQTTTVTVPIGHPTASSWNWGYLQGVSVNSTTIEAVAYKTVTASGVQWNTLASGPFYGILYIAGGALAIFAILLLVDAVVSPSGTGWIYIGTTARTLYGLAADGHLPQSFLRLNKYRVPLWPTVAALILGLLFLLPFPTWFAISSFITTTTVFTYIVGGPALIALRRMAPDAPRPIKIPLASVIGALATIAAFLIVYWSTFYYLWFAIALILGGLPLFYLYTMVNRFKLDRKYAIAAAIVYWAALIASTYFLIYLPFALPAGWPSSTPTTMLKLKPTHIIYFVAYLAIMIASTVGLTLFLASKAGDRDGARRHINAGWWVIATIFSALTLSFLGSFSVFETPIIPFPWDTVIAALVALGLYLYGAYSGIMTDDLVAVLKEIGVPIQ